MKAFYAISVLLFSLPCFCRAQVVGSGIFCDELGNCNENSSCIKSYHELELYIKGNREIIEGLKMHFLQLVRLLLSLLNFHITFKFQTVLTTRWNLIMLNVLMLQPYIFGVNQLFTFLVHEL